MKSDFMFMKINKLFLFVLAHEKLSIYMVKVRFRFVNIKKDLCMQVSLLVKLAG